MVRPVGLWRFVSPWRHLSSRQHPLGPIRIAIAAALALAIASAAVLTAFALAWLNPKTVSERLDVIKIALAVVAGIGGVVALVVAYRRQHVLEAAEQREQNRLYAERFDRASEKLGSDSAAVRLAGVHALANLADDWIEGRQTCIDVLCAYLRIPPGSQPDSSEDPGGHVLWMAMREVRTTVLSLITSHMHRDAPVPWHGSDLNLTGVTFDEYVDFRSARFSGGEVSFAKATFSSGTFTFFDADFAGADVIFFKTEFRGAMVSFANARFSGSWVSFGSASFSSGQVEFAGAEFSGGKVGFWGSSFVGSYLSFDGAEFRTEAVSFDKAEFRNGQLDFTGVGDWSHPPSGLPDRSDEVVKLPDQGT